MATRMGKTIKTAKIVLEKAKSKPGAYVPVVTGTERDREVMWELIQGLVADADRKSNSDYTMVLTNNAQIEILHVGEGKDAG